MTKVNRHSIHLANKIQLASVVPDRRQFKLTYVSTLKQNKMIQIPASYYNYKHLLPFSWQQVLRLEGSGNYTVFVLFDGSTHISTKSLGNYEPFLPAGFLRVHKGHAVNLVAIVSVHRSGKAIELSDGFCCEVARRRWRQLKAKIFATFNEG